MEANSNYQLHVDRFSFTLQRDHGTTFDKRVCGYHFYRPPHYVASVRSSGSLKRAGEQRSEEDNEIELAGRKGKEPRVTEFEDGEIMSIELLPERPGHSVRLGQQLPGGIQEALTGILRKNVDLFRMET